MEAPPSQKSSLDTPPLRGACRSRGQHTLARCSTRTGIRSLRSVTVSPTVGCGGLLAMGTHASYRLESPRPPPSCQPPPPSSFQLPHSTAFPAHPVNHRLVCPALLMLAAASLLSANCRPPATPIATPGSRTLTSSAPQRSPSLRVVSTVGRAIRACDNHRTVS